MNWCVSDIHGCFYTLQKLLDKIYIIDSKPQLIFVGDYIDRGLHSRKVLDLMIKLQEQGAICLRGNHDDVVDWMVNNHCKSDIPYMVGSKGLTLLNVGKWWLQNGFGTTLVNYIDHALLTKNGENFDDHHLKMLFDFFVENFPEEHKRFLLNLSLYWDNSTHCSCHAYLDPTKALPVEFSGDFASNALWSRFPNRTISREGSLISAGLGIQEPVWDKIGVFGHTPVERYGQPTPIRFHNIRLIDTGAFMDGYLTAYNCEEDSHILQSTDSQDIVK